MNRAMARHWTRRAEPMTRRWARSSRGNVHVYPVDSPVPRPPKRRAERMMTYPFNLRDGDGYCIARLILPDDLTMAEAGRMSTMLKTITVDYQPEKETA